MSTARSGAGSARTPGQLFALVFGAVYLIVGIAGFFVTTQFFGETGEELILFEVNGFHNVVHILVGALWLGGSRTPSSAKSVNLLIGVVYLAFAVLGFFGALDELISHNASDAILHLVSGGLSLYFGTAGSGVRTTATA